MSTEEIKVATTLSSSLGPAWGEDAVFRKAKVTAVNIETKEGPCHLARLENTYGYASILIDTDLKDERGFQWRISKPWDGLKPGDLCKVRDYEEQAWELHVFAGAPDILGKPVTYTGVEGKVVSWDLCEPLTEEEKNLLKEGVKNE